MLSFLSELIGRKPKDYAVQKAALGSADSKTRMTLAKDSATSKEILYYLAEKDPDPKVRRAVAKNKSTPVQVTPVLAEDADADVRLALAGRLVDLLPGVSSDKQSQLYAFAVQALGTLALDEVLKIRKALSATLKDHAHTPPKVAGQLARDVEREVSEPILRFCAALSDEDLLDILKSHPASWVIEAVAGRPYVSEDVSQAVIESDHVPGGTELLKNEGSSIAETLLHYIVEKARSLPEWQKPMALRKSLPMSVAKELAEFVDASVRDLLMAREDFDEQSSAEIAAVFRRRMDFDVDEEASPASVEERLRDLIKDGNLTEETISDALAMRDHAFVYGAIAHMVRATMQDVEKIFEMRAPKPIVALCWKAGLSMRMAFSLQKDVGQVAPKELLYPKNGTDYPLSDEDLNWQLDFLGLKVA